MVRLRLAYGDPTNKTVKSILHAGADNQPLVADMFQPPPAESLLLASMVLTCPLKTSSEALLGFVYRGGSTEGKTRKLFTRANHHQVA